MSLYDPRGRRAKDAYRVKSGQGKDQVTRKATTNLYKRRKGKGVKVPLPIFYNPRARYGPMGPQGVGVGPGDEGDPIGMEPKEGEGSGRKGGEEGPDAIYGEVSKLDILKYLRKNLSLEMLKKGKILEPDGLRFPFHVKQGPESLFSLEATVEEALLRQIIWDEPLNPCDFDEDDLRYWATKIKWKEVSEAVVIFKRDVSASVDPGEMDMSYALSALIEIWLEDQYKDRVTPIFLPHNHVAWEDTRKGYYSLKPSGGTQFAPAFDLVMDMIEGRDYPKEDGVVRKQIDSQRKDIYLVDMSDGEDWQCETGIASLEKLMPHLTRYCYLETDLGSYFKSQGSTTFLSYLKNRFRNEIMSGKIKYFEMDDVEQTPEAMQAFFGNGKNRGKD